jgi:hypothetical protein
VRISKAEAQIFIDFVEGCDDGTEDEPFDFEEWRERLVEVIKLCKTIRVRQAHIDARTKPLEPEPAKPGELVLGYPSPEVLEVQEAVFGRIADAMGIDLDAPEHAGRVVEADGSRPEASSEAITELVEATLLKQVPGERFIVSTRPYNRLWTTTIRGEAGKTTPDCIAIAQRIRAVFAVRVRVVYECEVQIDG